MNKQQSELMAIRDYLTTLLTEDNDDIVVTSNGQSLVSLETKFVFTYDKAKYLVEITDISYDEAA
jgi:hypothetical protein